MENATADADSELDPIPGADADSLYTSNAAPDPEDDTCNENDGCGACGGGDQDETADEDLPAAEGGVV
ncbi:MAG: hypothetical protein JST22_15340 [Bacteroidetes bacterium]|nr:hypothetical protein [Bacteroidota bacterium]